MNINSVVKHIRGFPLSFAAKGGARYAIGCGMARKIEVIPNYRE